MTLFSLVGPVAIGTGALYIYATGGRTVSTENAYVKADKIAISADISGRVVQVNTATRLYAPVTFCSLDVFVILPDRQVSRKGQIEAARKPLPP